MKVKYFHIVPADCTSDPHPVHYGGDSDRDIHVAMLNDIVEVCESDMVQNVRCVHITFGDHELIADHYSDFCFDEDKSKGKATDEFAVKHKTYGLWFGNDAEKDRRQKYDKETGKAIGFEYGNFRALPPGLTGVKRASEYIAEHLKPDDTLHLSIGVVWSFAGDSSCSDYIEINGEYCTGHEVNYGSQDWWIRSDGYHEWCDQMEALLGKHFPRETR